MTNEEKENKLREAAESEYFENHLTKEEDKHNEAVLIKFGRKCFITGAKSEAAREYHQQEQKDISLWDLRKKLLQNIPELGESLTARVLSTLLSHLQPGNESDAMQFAEWVAENGYDKRYSLRWVPTGGPNILNPSKTTSQLYEAFKLSKLNKETCKT